MGSSGHAYLSFGMTPTPPKIFNLFRTHDIPYADETPGSNGDHPPQAQSDTDYETCDSGMSSDRSSMESGTIGGTNDDERGTRWVSCTDFLFIM